MSDDFTGAQTIVQDEGLSMFHMLRHKGFLCTPSPRHRLPPGSVKAALMQSPEQMYDVLR